MIVNSQFHDSWKMLCDWLDAQEQKLRQLSTNTAKMKQELEELQVLSLTVLDIFKIISKILFLPCSAMRKCDLCLRAASACLSVRLSRSCIMLKRVNVFSNFFHLLVVTPF